MKCSNSFNCSGVYQLNTHATECGIWSNELCDCDVQRRVWVIGMDLPVWVQCSECGVSPIKQGKCINEILQEIKTILG